MKGLFISFEGIEGTGKTTQARLLAEYLQQKGYRTVLTEEPGGTLISRGIRSVLLRVEHAAMHPVTELLLYNAARSQHIHEVILPALADGKIVITDRFSDSTAAYQGHGRGIDLRLIENLDRIATEGLRPDFTILLDIDVEVGLRRNRGAHKVDRIELEDITFHEKVRKGFREIARREKERVILFDASGSPGEVSEKIRRAVERKLGIP